ncbi:MAG: RsmB/NOP family class I SAM-dependent RNA methyltransferase [Bosea sp. (in: a-proteobacteria)]
MTSDSYSRPASRTPSRQKPQRRARSTEAEPAEPARNVPENALQSRAAAAALFEEVLRSGQSIEDCLSRLVSGLDERDLGLVRAISLVSFRRLGTIRQALRARMAQGFAAGGERMEALLVTAVAQILFMDVPDHAAVDCAVTLVGESERDAHKRGFVNAVLRRISREKSEILADAEADPLRDLPPWLAARWVRHYGEAIAAAMAAAQRHEPTLDITVKADAAGWAEKLGARLLPGGNLRLESHASIETLPGYEEGAWWVQDAAAALPALLIGAKPEQRIADLCAAPGGKTMQLAAMGAHITAVDRSAPRMEQLRRNLTRTNLSAEIIIADAAKWQAEPFDAVLVDAPCTSTGTMRRHPDVAWTKTEADIEKLASLQTRLIDNAIALTKPGGTIVFCTCSLEPEEGEVQLQALLARRSDVRLSPIMPDEVGGLADAITPLGELRTRPDQLPHETPRQAGWAGFYAMRLIKL